MSRDVATNSELRPDADATLDFLSRVLADAPWVLNSFPCEGGPPRVKTFFPHMHADGGRDAIRRYLHEENFVQRRNIYFALNPSETVHDRKAAKPDIKTARLLYVDCDPRPGHALADERDMHRQLLLRPNAAVPLPSVVVDSGRGHWGIWMLAEPVETATAAQLAEYEDRNKRLLPIYIGDDKCTNIDRLSRLPGTINWPDKEKRAKGAVAAVATVVEANWAKHPIDAFPPAIEPSRAAKSAVQAEIAAAPRIGSVDELDQWGVCDRVKIAVAQGRDPSNPKTKDDSRSAWAFDVACEMVRKDVPDGLIYSILTDPDLGISESILETGSKADFCARRLIARAKDYAIHPALMEMNDKHAVLLCEGGKTRVVSWVQDDDGREVPSQQGFDDFRNRYMNQLVTVATDEKGKPVQVPKGDWWLKQARRRQFLALTFRPGVDGDCGEYMNLWRGWGVTPRKGSWALLRSHVEEVLAAGNAAHAEYIFKFAAWAVQNPGEPAEVALVLRGAKGTGKGLFARALKDVFGNHGMQVTNAQHFGGKHNGHLRDVCLLFVDEALGSLGKTEEAVLKGLITEPSLVLEPKYRDAFSAKNRLHIVMCSDQEWVAPAGPGERRFAVFDVTSDRKGDSAWFAAIAAELDSGGREAMLHDLLTLDLAGWHPRNDVPQTAALQRQKEHSLEPLMAWMLTLIEDGVLPGQGCRKPNMALAAALLQHAKESVPALKLETAHKIGGSLRAWGCKKFHDGRARGWCFPPLADLRAAWVQRVGEWDWGEDGHAEWGGTDEPF